jgi:hypothetical protein
VSGYHEQRARPHLERARREAEAAARLLEIAEQNMAEAQRLDRQPRCAATLKDDRECHVPAMAAVSIHQVSTGNVTETLVCLHHLAKELKRQHDRYGARGISVSAQMIDPLPKDERTTF